MKPLFKKGQTVITSKGNIGIIDEDQCVDLYDTFDNFIKTSKEERSIDLYVFSYGEECIKRSIPVVKLGDKVYQINEDKLELVNNPKELKLIKLFDKCFDLIENYYSTVEADKLRTELKHILQ